jgi:hypothetical protein
MATVIDIGLRHRVDGNLVSINANVIENLRETPDNILDRGRDSLPL